MATNPVLVIGVGEAGVRMLKNFSDVIEKENVDKSDFKLFAIDTAEDVDNNFPSLSNDRKLILKNPMGWDEMVDRYEYLKPGDEPGSQGGVTRNRPVARGLVDDSENFSVLYNRLESEVSDLVVGDEIADIWILNSLGGGTGSGIQPILSAMLYDVVRELDTAGAHSPGITINGIGTIPKLDDIQGGHYPDVKSEYIANSYVALRELRSMFERDHHQNPIEIDVYADDRGTLKENQIPAITETPFDKYFVLPIREEELQSEESRNNMNRIVSDTILYFSLVPGTENYPDIDDADIGYEEEAIYTINETTISMPEDLIDQYVEIDDDLAQLNSDETKLKQLKDKYEQNKELLSHILDSGRGEVPDKGGFNSLVNYCDTEVENILSSVATRKISSDDIDEGRERVITTVQEELESIHNRFEESKQISGEERTLEDDIDLISNDDINPVSVIVEYFYYDQLYAHITDEIGARQFENIVNSTWSDYGSDIVAAMEAEGKSEEIIEAVKMGDTEERYDRLIDWLEYRLGELDSDDDDGILFGFFGGDDEASERDTIKRLINNLKAKKADHDQLINLRDEAGSKRSAVRDRIQSLRDEFEIAIDSVSEDISRTESERDRLKAEKANMKDPENDDSLVEFSPEQFASFSVSEPDNLSRDDVQRIKQGEYNLKDIVDSPAWDENEVLLNIKKILETQVHERITDQASSPVRGFLQILRHNNNNWIDEEVREIVDNSYAPFEGVEDSCRLSDPLELRFLATYAPINWSETSEFGSIHRALLNDDRSAVSMFVETDEENEDEIREQYFRPAYPELYGD